MTETARSLRMPLRVVLARLANGEGIRFLDARGARPHPEPALQIPGSTRIQPLVLRIDPTWGRSQLTVVYCA